MSETSSREPSEVFEGSALRSPSLILSTCLGNLQYTPPHLLADVLRCDDVPLIGQLELADVIGRDFGDVALSSLQPEVQGTVRPLLVASARHMSRGAGVCSKLSLDIDAPGGRKAITPAKFAARVAIDRPWAVIALADEVPMTSGNKRLTKSTERTMNMFKQLVALPPFEIGNNRNGHGEYAPPVLFGVTVAGFTESHMGTMAAELVRLGARGIVIGGAHMGETQEQLGAAISRVRQAVGVTVPLLVQGADTMAQVLHALRCGVDLLASNIPALATARGLALIPSCQSTEDRNRNRIRDDDSGSSGSSGGKGGDPKKPRIEPAAAAGSRSGSGTGSAKVEESEDQETAEYVGRFGPVLDLRHQANRADLGPVDADCSCHCCRHHTRAYVHHLLRAKELLGEALLYAHNQHRLLALVGAVHASRSGTRGGAQGVATTSANEEDVLSAVPVGESARDTAAPVITTGAGVEAEED